MQRNPLSAYSPKSFTQKTFSAKQHFNHARKDINRVKVLGIAAGGTILAGVF